MVFTPAVPALNRMVSVCSAPSLLSVHLACRRASSRRRATSILTFWPGVPVLMKTDLRGQARIGKRALRDLDVGDFEIVRHLLAPEADGVDRNALAADFGDGFQIDAAGIIRAVAHQHHRADRQTGGIGQHLLQAFADVRRLAGRVELIELLECAPDDRSAGKAALENASVKLRSARS